MAGAKKTLMRSLGEFFGHVARGVTAPVKPKKPATTVVREQVEEARVETPAGPMTLRRRTIDEVEVPEVPRGKPRA
jgi:hypothetical protein